MSPTDTSSGLFHRLTTLAGVALLRGRGPCNFGRSPQRWRCIEVSDDFDFQTSAVAFFVVITHLFYWFCSRRMGARCEVPAVIVLGVRNRSVRKLFPPSDQGHAIAVSGGAEAPTRQRVKNLLMCIARSPTVFESLLTLVTNATTTTRRISPVGTRHRCISPSQRRMHTATSTSTCTALRRQTDYKVDRCSGHSA